MRKYWRTVAVAARYVTSLTTEDAD